MKGGAVVVDMVYSADVPRRQSGEKSLYSLRDFHLYMHGRPQHFVVALHPILRFSVLGPILHLARLP